MTYLQDHERSNSSSGRQCFNPVHSQPTVGDLTHLLIRASLPLADLLHACFILSRPHILAKIVQAPPAARHTDLESTFCAKISILRHVLGLSTDPTMCAWVIPLQLYLHAAHDYTAQSDAFGELGIVRREAFLPCPILGKRLSDKCRVEQVISAQLTSACLWQGDTVSGHAPSPASSESSAGA